MSVIRVTASKEIPAPAATVYGITADYHRGHPSILPPEYFQDLVVEAGGRGAGTPIRFTMIAFGQRTVSPFQTDCPASAHCR